MKHPDQIFADIARKHLFIETLETRKSDSLDFHNVAVWCVLDALTAAYEAGAKSAALDLIVDTTGQHTPGPWRQDWHFIVAPDPAGIHPDIYIAEIAEEDSDGRIASPEQQEANGRLIVASPRLLAACRLVVERWERGDLAEAVRQCDALVTELKSE